MRFCRNKWIRRGNVWWRLGVIRNLIKSVPIGDADWQRNGAPFGQMSFGSFTTRKTHLAKRRSISLPSPASPIWDAFNQVADYPEPTTSFGLIHLFRQNRIPRS